MSNQENQPYRIAPTTTQYQSRTPELDYPGKTIGIVAMVLSLVSLIGAPTALIGVVMGHISYSQGKKAGFKNTYALVAIIAGWIVVGFFIAIMGFVLLAALMASAY